LDFFLSEFLSILFSESKRLKTGKSGNREEIQADSGFKQG